MTRAMLHGRERRPPLDELRELRLAFFDGFGAGLVDRPGLDRPTPDLRSVLPEDAPLAAIEAARMRRAAAIGIDPGDAVDNE